MTISDRTLAQELQRRFRGARVFRLFCMKLGPTDNTYVSALAWGTDGNVIECRASALTLEDAFVQLLNNVDEATAPEDK